MKKNYFYLLTIVMLTMLCAGFASCGSDDDDEVKGGNSIDTSPISLYAGDDKIIQGANTITSQNTFVAYSKDNTVYGYHVGETTLLVNNKYHITVHVYPKYHLYDDPVCKWGCDMNYVKYNQKQGTLNSKKSNSAQLVYENAGGATGIIYKFEHGVLTYAGAVVSTVHATTMAKYLAERYIMITGYTAEDRYFFGGDGMTPSEANTIVYLEVYNASYLIAVYAPASNFATRSPQAIGNLIEEIKKDIE